MTNTKIDMNTIVNTTLVIIADEWNEHSTKDKYEMLKELLLNPEEFPSTEQIERNENYSFNDWILENEESCSICYEMKQVLLDVLYEYAGEYAKRQRPNTAEMDCVKYDDLMVKFWSDVPHDIKKTVLFGHCLIISLEWGKVVTDIESTTTHGDDDLFVYAMNQIMNHHLIQIGEDYCVDKIVRKTNPLNKANPNRVSQIEKFIDMINEYVIDGADSENLIATMYSENMKAMDIADAWIDENGMSFYCADENLENQTCIDIPINDIASITIDPTVKQVTIYVIEKTDGIKYNVAFIAM